VACPNCETLPTMPNGDMRLLLWPPLGHTRVKLKGWASSFPEARLSIDQDALVFDISGASLTSSLVQMAGQLTDGEQTDTKALVLAPGQVPSFADYPRVTSLRAVIGRHQSAWLIDMLRENRLTSHFQPLFTASSPTHFACEALLRGHDRDGAPIAAGAIFKAASDAALAFQTDLRARLSAVELFAEARLPGKLFINFSPTAIYDPAYCLRRTVSRIHDLGLDPARVVFEVIESEQHTSLNHLRGILSFYRAEGFGVALDDVGAGYNGLAALDALQPDYVKIDMQLVRDIDTKPGKALLVGHLIGACAKLGIRTIAEGIETDRELKTLRGLGADYVQGYHLARPAPAESIKAALV
jgi:EAL domain-containing protein (putative c-di-GMP-specific phosphodiesterase class I)